MVLEKGKQVMLDCYEGLERSKVMNIQAILEAHAKMMASQAESQKWHQFKEEMKKLSAEDRKKVQVQ